MQKANAHSAILHLLLIKPEKWLFLFFFIISLIFLAVFNSNPANINIPGIVAGASLILIAVIINGAYGIWGVSKDDFANFFKGKIHPTKLPPGWVFTTLMKQILLLTTLLASASLGISQIVRITNPELFNVSGSFVLSLILGVSVSMLVFYTAIFLKIYSLSRSTSITLARVYSHPISPFNSKNK